MTKKFVHDQKDHTDEYERWNLTKNVSQRRTLTGEYLEALLQKKDN